VPVHDASLPFARDAHRPGTATAVSGSCETSDFDTDPDSDTDTDFDTDSDSDINEALLLQLPYSVGADTAISPGPVAEKTLRGKVPFPAGLAAAARSG